MIRRVLRAIAMRAVQPVLDELEDEMADDLELGMAWRGVRELLPPTWAMTLGVTRRHATASVYRGDAAGHAQLIHAEGGETPVDALYALGAWLRSLRR